MEGLKRITPEEVGNYVMLNIYDPNVCTRAVAFMLLPSSNTNPASLYNSPWEDVTYYGNPDSSLERHPLEVMLDEWTTSKPNDPGNLTGENPFSHD